MPTQNNGWGNVFFHLLPFIEQKNLYQTNLTSGVNPMGENTTPPGQPYYSATAGVGTTSFISAVRHIKVFTCPSDPSVPTGGLYTDVLFGYQWATTSYAGNYLVYGVPNSDLTGWFTWQGSSSIPAFFRDGMSTTILFAEKEAVCDSTTLGLPRTGRPARRSSRGMQP